MNEQYVFAFLGLWIIVLVFCLWCGGRERKKIDHPMNPTMREIETKLKELKR